MNNVINLAFTSSNNERQQRRRGKRPVVNTSDRNNNRNTRNTLRNSNNTNNNNSYNSRAAGPSNPARSLRRPRLSSPAGRPSPPPERRPIARVPMRGARVARYRPAGLPSNRNFDLNAQVAVNAANNGLITQFGSFRLQPHQVAVSQLFVKPATPGVLLYFKVGSGKTLASIAAVENLARVERKRRKVLVIGPASLAENYMKELQKAGVNPDRYEFMSFQKLHSGANRIRRALLAHSPDTDPVLVRRKMNAMLNKVGQYVYKRVNGISFSRGKVLVVDEVQNVKNPVGEYLTSLMEVSRTAHKRLLLTGTPVVNYPSDMGAYLGLIDPNKNEKLTVKMQIQKDGIVMEVPAFEKNFGRTARENVRELDALMRCTTLYYEPSAEIQRMYYPTKTEHWVNVPLTNQQLRRHFEIAARMRTPQNIDIHNSALEDQKNTKAYINAARQINNIWGIYHPKIDIIVNAIIHEVKNNNGKCIFYDFFKDSWKLVRSMLLQREPAIIKAASFSGETSDRERIAIVQDYNSGKLNVLLLSAAGGEGLDLKNTTQMHILQPWWNEEKINQVIGRAVRYKSHDGGRRHVDVFRYCAVFPPGGDTAKIAQLPRGKLPIHMGFAYNYTADELLKDISVRKATDNQTFLTRLVRISDENLRACV